MHKAHVKSQQYQCINILASFVWFRFQVTVNVWYQHVAFRPDRFGYRIELVVLIYLQ
jgi:hypothetical protein